MARRTPYKLNFQNIQCSNFFQLAPISYTEVIPGDTIQGQVKVRLFSDTTKVPLMNRAYLDLYAFYVPYRLLWDGFPSWVAESPDATGNPPTVQESWLQNFEGARVYTAFNSIAWLRYAYNKIYNNFFLPEEYRDVFNRSEDQAGTLGVLPMRQTTFLESLKSTASDFDTDISNVTTISGLRKAFAEDRFARVRNYYGSKYTDYLASLGVEASWSILDEPEVIGQKHADLPYRIVNTTADTTEGQGTAEFVGDPAGYYDGVCTLNIRRTFCPEHGLVVVMAAPKIDTINRNSGVHTAIAKENQPSEYWSPQFETEDKREWRTTVMQGNAIEDRLVYTPRFEDLRKGNNMAAAVDSDVLEQAYFGTFNPVLVLPANFAFREATALNDLFQGRLGGDSTKAQLQMTGVHRITRLSALRPSTSSVGSV